MQREIHIIGKYSQNTNNHIENILIERNNIVERYKIKLIEAQNKIWGR